MDEDIERIIEQKQRNMKISPEREALGEVVTQKAEPLNQMINIAYEVNPEFGKHILISTTFAFIMMHSKTIDEALNTLEEIRREIIRTDHEVNK
jgi:hydrogenase maturation factor